MGRRIVSTLLLAALPGLAQPVLEPRVAVLCAGQSQAFRVHGTYAGPGPLRWSVEADDGGPAGTLDPSSGHYTAPATDGVRTVKVIATRMDGAGTAQVTLLPAQPFGLLDRILGPGWLEPFAMDLPFFDLETGRRFPAPGRVLGRQGGPGQVLLAGYGRPCRVALPQGGQAQAQLLSYREGDQLVRRDVTGLAECTLTPRAIIRDAQVEALVPAAGRERTWWSQVQPVYVWTRGLLHLAGSVREPGSGDGAGETARFREPWGLARMVDGRGSWTLAVADAGDHAVRLVDRRGSTTTLCGTPGQAGHWDTPAGWRCCRRPPESRLRQPTHLAPVVEPRGRFQGQDLLLADSGNHVIRGLAATGEVTTLAGCAGLAGHRDTIHPYGALFRDPRGLAQDSQGNVYVADRGNHAIRVIRPCGQVTTLAGTPGQPGTRDGLEAQFSDLKALAWAPWFGTGPHLLVLDGHAVRAVAAGTGQVATVLGQVDQPGFRDAAGPDLAGRVDILRGPCLRDPADLAWDPPFLYLADRGNHAVRRWAVDWALLTTLAGDPGCAETRWGLLRDGMPVPPGPDQAALAGPRALALGPSGFGYRLAVAAGPCLGMLYEGVSRRDAWLLEAEAPAPAARNQPVVLRVRARPEPNTQGAIEPGLLTAEFREADGSPGPLVQAPAPSGHWVALQAVLTQPGRAEAVIRFVSPDGVCAGVRQSLTIQ